MSGNTEANVRLLGGRNTSLVGSPSLAPRAVETSARAASTRNRVNEVLNTVSQAINPVPPNYNNQIVDAPPDRRNIHESPYSQPQRPAAYREAEQAAPMISKSKTQAGPFNEYQTLDECGENEWEYESTLTGIGTVERQCSGLAPDACPSLSGALNNTVWDADRPNVACTYSVDSITTGEQLREYVKNWGYDDDFNNTIMPAIIPRPTKNGPRGTKGPIHENCSSLLGLDLLGTEARRWAESNPILSDAVIEDYCYSTGGTDCSYVLRNTSPLYWYMRNHPSMKDIPTEEWYVPARTPTMYIQTSEIRRKKINPMNKKTKKMVSKAASEIASVSDDPEATKQELAAICACPIDWKPVGIRRRRWMVHFIKNHPHEYYGRRMSSRSPDVVSDPTVAREMRGDQPAGKGELIGSSQKPKAKGRVRAATVSGSTVIIGIVVAMIIIAVIIVIIVVVSRSRSTGLYSGYGSREPRRAPQERFVNDDYMLDGYGEAREIPTNDRMYYV